MRTQSDCKCIQAKNQTSDTHTESDKGETHRVMVRHTVQPHDRAAGKYKRGVRSEFCGAQARTPNTQAPDSAVHTQATETGLEGSKPHFQQTRNRPRHAKPDPCICREADGQVYAQTADAHADATGQGNWNLEDSPFPCTPAVGPLRGKVVNEEGGGPAAARVTTAAGPTHRRTSAWPHLRRGALAQTTWDGWVSPQRASGETEEAQQACSTERLKPRAAQPTTDSQGSDIPAPASVSSPSAPAGTGRGHLHRRPGVREGPGHSCSPHSPRSMGTRRAPSK